MAEGEVIPIGRPTKLTPAVMAKAKVFKSKDKIPTIEEFALYLGINRSSVYAWKEKSEEFSHIVDNLLAEQARILINKGLVGEFNSSITKLILSGKHGYVEKSEVDNNINMPTPILGSASVKRIEDVPTEE